MISSSCSRAKSKFIAPTHARTVRREIEDALITVVGKVGSARCGSSVNYIEKRCTHPMVDLGNVSPAIGSQLISLSRSFRLCVPLLSLLRSPAVRPSRRASLRSARRDNSYVLRMHNVPNYFTLLLLRVINARRLALDRAYAASSARDLLPRDYEIREERIPSLPLPPSLLDGRSASFFHASFGYQLSAISYQLYTEACGFPSFHPLRLPSLPPPSPSLSLHLSPSLGRRE